MKPATILLVEDEESSAFLFQHTITELGILHPLQVAQDGREAMDYLEGNGRFADRTTFPIPSLIVLDLKMPRITGFEVLDWVRKQPELRRLIIIVMSASASESDVNRAYELGANAYIVKPSGMEKLGDVLRSIRDFWLTHNYPPTIRGPASGE